MSNVQVIGAVLREDSGQSAEGSHEAGVSQPLQRIE